MDDVKQCKKYKDLRIKGSVLLKYCGEGGDLVVPADVTEKAVLLPDAGD